MFKTQYFCLVAGFKELTLDAENKGFEPRAIIDEIIGEVSAADAKAIELLYTYYDCENLSAARSGSNRYNPLGNLSREEVEAELLEPTFLPEALASVVKRYSSRGGEESEGALSFERALFEAYFNECQHSKVTFLREWSQTDSNLRNIAAAISARIAGVAIEDTVVGGGDVADALRRSSAADFGLRGELPYIDAVIAAISDEPNIVEKEHKIDNIRWAEVDEAAQFDYFGISAVMSYLVKVNIVARWSQLDEARGRAMFEQLMADLSAKDKINK